MPPHILAGLCVCIPIGLLLPPATKLDAKTLHSIAPPRWRSFSQAVAAAGSRLMRRMAPGALCPARPDGAEGDLARRHPRPRLSGDAFQEQRDPLASADAERDQPAAQTITPHRVKQPRR